jgi:hypothetical protein
MRRGNLLLLIFLGLSLMSPGPSAAEDPFVAIVKTIQGSAFVVRNGESIPAAIGMEMQRADIAKTGRNGHLGLVFSDDSRISMGPNTELVVDDYRFKPNDQQLSLIIRIFHGTISFLSGQLTKLSPESVKLVMPAATIGVRGTHVLAKVDSIDRSVPLPALLGSYERGKFK